MAGTVRVLLFASAREAVGSSQLQPKVEPAGIGLTELVERLGLEFPRLRPVLRVSRLVVNGEYIGSKHVTLRAGDEVAIHPPYSGG
ncbi:MAG: MoaD/ThiS family protein [Thermoplasmata archaeon]|nr:MoaD/ThiS family protein [Thermoplasmata archaeon]